MGWDGWITLAVVGAVLLALALTRYAPDTIMMGGLSLLLLLGIVNSEEALAGFSNEGVATIGLMFVVVAGLRETGAIAWLAQFLLGRPKSLAGAQARLMFPVAVISAFMNNTPLVAMMIPAVTEWAKRYRLVVSKLMIPLSYATVLGGLCTIIGTSTNLVVNGFVRKFAKLEPEWFRDAPNGFLFFDPIWVGLPCALMGLGYLLLAGRQLLPDRTPPMQQLANPREYTLEMIVESNSPLVGKTVEQAGLRHLESLFLVEIDRGGTVLAAVGPEETLQANDRLVFAGIVDSIVELQRLRGLKPATDQVFKLDAPRSTRCLIEAVVSNSHPSVRHTIRDARFRSTYGAVVIAVARHGERVRSKVGDIILQAGDTLLLEGEPSFVNIHRNSTDYFLVREVENSTPPRHERATLALLILTGMVLLASLEFMDVLHAALLASGLMIVCRCCTGTAARQTIDISLLVAIAASFGISRALDKTGAAAALAANVLTLVGDHPWCTLAVVYFLTMLCTEVLTNNAAAALMFPIALAAARDLHVSPLPFAMAVMIAASAAFATPIGYQTHLMVYGPGGYRFLDYVRIGVPLNFVVAATALLLLPWVWPF